MRPPLECAVVDTKLNFTPTQTSALMECLTANIFKDYCDYSDRLFVSVVAYYDVSDNELHIPPCAPDKDPMN